MLDRLKKRLSGPKVIGIGLLSLLLVCLTSIYAIPAFQTVVAGNKAPADATANPTDSINSWSLVGLWNGATWDKLRGDTTNGLWANVKTFYSAAADNSANSSTKIPVLSGKANASAPTWTEGYQVPLSVDLSGNLRTTGVVSGALTANQGTANTQANRWPVFLSDGTNGVGTASNPIRTDPTGTTSQPITPAYSGTAFYAIKHTNVAAVSINLPFGFTSKKVVVEAPGSNTAEIVIDWLGGTAVAPAANTAGDDVLAPGRTIILDEYAVTSISVIAVSGTQSVYVRAFN